MPRRATTKEARIKLTTRDSPPTKNTNEPTVPPFNRKCRVWNSRDGITGLFRFGAEATARDPSKSFARFEPMRCSLCLVCLVVLFLSLVLACFGFSYGECDGFGDQGAGQVGRYI